MIVEQEAKKAIENFSMPDNIGFGKVLPNFFLAMS